MSGLSNAEHNCYVSEVILGLRQSSFSEILYTNVPDCITSISLGSNPLSRGFHIFNVSVLQDFKHTQIALI